MALQSVLPALILFAASFIPLSIVSFKFPFWLTNLFLTSILLFCAGRLAFERSNVSAKTTALGLDHLPALSFLRHPSEQILMPKAFRSWPT